MSGSYALVRTRSGPGRLDLESFAHATGLHPELLRRLVALGLFDAASDAGGELWFTPAAVAEAARIQRLRAGFSLNYAAVGLVIDLLDRIAELQAATRQPRRPHSRHIGG